MAAGFVGQPPSWLPASSPPAAALADDKQPESKSFFQEACGAAGPMHLRIDSPRLPASVERILHQPYAIVRRERRGALATGRPRTCAFLQVIAGRIFFVDLPGIAENGDSSELRSGWMDEVEPLQVGPFGIRAHLPDSASLQPPITHDFALHAAPVAWNPLTQEAPPWQPLPEIGLELLPDQAGRRGGEPQRLKRVLALIGTDPACNVRLFGPTVAPFHCYLVLCPASVWVVDLREGDGIGVNGKRRPWARLAGGDELQVGRFSFRVHGEQPGAHPFRTPLPEPAGSPAVASSDSAPDIHLSEETPATALTPVAPRPVSNYPGPVASPLPTATAGQGGMQLIDNLELLSAVLMPVVQEFRQMQQQMLQHFDRSMNLMARLVEMSRQDQPEPAGDDRPSVEQLKDELAELRRQLAARAAEPPLQLPRARPPLSPNGSAAPVPAQDNGDAMHLLLHDRIAALKDSQAGRLHKIIQSLLGR